MSYTIEVYRGNQKAEKHFGIYALYVMFYPQLVAGPIERPQNILHQFHERQSFSAANLYFGLRLMLWGLFKKVVIADRLSIFVDRVFDNPSAQNSIVLVLGAAFFAIQIYCDFSGYSDMAIGAAKTMGFNLMTNFNRPYFATNIKNFWDRWHISLSTWFRDYVYIPLGGNRVKVSRLYFNIAIVFLLSGFWHGANWTFIIWGALHAIYLFFNMFVSRNIGWGWATKYKFYTCVAWIITFLFVCFAWIFFRAESVNNAFVYIRSLINNIGLGHNIRIPPAGLVLGFGAMSYSIVIISLITMFFVEYKFSPRLEIKLSFKRDLLFCCSVLIMIFLFGVFEKNSFIYFQF
ncbi:MBOAT family O-acyltransferase [Terrimonas sp.]|uniref:MBOAT family O-acyltransferase n=1 Tax=Terrimonas sp. TaxID=1914338 RepID=UPI001F0C8E4C|nr:MBOAT family O-acyltransferase [Terrimonas sp.]